MGHSQKYRSAVGRLFFLSVCESVCVVDVVVYLWWKVCWREMRDNGNMKLNENIQGRENSFPKHTQFYLKKQQWSLSKQRNERISSDTCLRPFRLSHNTLFLCVWRGKSVYGVCCVLHDEQTYEWFAGWMNELRDEWIEVLDEQMDEHMEGQMHRPVY